MIKRTGRKSGLCHVCGKKASRSITFEQSLNPWNLNADGEPKTASQIHDELVAKIREWQKDPVSHARCEE
jgi:hypothetical protein